MQPFSGYVEQISRTIQANLPALHKPGVLSIRPGYRFVGNWFTKEPAIVVIGHNVTKENLPDEINGFPVDVREATPLQRMRHGDPARFAGIAASAGAVPGPRFENEVTPDGNPLRPPVMMEVVPKGEYHPPATGPAMHEPAKIIEDHMTLTCCVGPDSGWPVLKTFLSGTQKQLTVGMYDFTSQHVLETVEEHLQEKSMALVLDHPAPNPTRDQTDDQTKADLALSIGQKLSFAWALTPHPNLVDQAIFANAYHIKVAVRDKNAFWLSSGNWNNSNQAILDAAGTPPSNADRDWHIVIEHPGLAEFFENHLQFDLQTALSHQVDGSHAIFGTPPLMSETALVEAAVAATSFNWPASQFRSKQFSGRFKVQPVLTPDNYVESIKPMLESAKKTLYIQTQYIHASDAAQDAPLMSLIDVIAKKQNAKVDVRIIMSEFEAQKDYLERLQMAGIDLASVRIQNKVHNKGFVIDSNTVALGSHNWSADGVIRNRDATLIVYDAPEVAQYYEQVFLYDWGTLAAQQAVG